MKVDRDKLLLAMARECINFIDLADRAQVSRATLHNASAGKNVGPDAVGRIARALGVDPAEIIGKDSRKDSGKESGNNGLTI